MSTMVDRVREYIRHNDPATNREIAEALGVETHRVQVATQWLVKSGEVKVTKPGRRLVHAWAEPIPFAGAAQAMAELQLAWAA
jgi:predicted transcriptional regulator